jgi:hypothetical protein
LLDFCSEEEGNNDFGEIEMITPYVDRPSLFDFKVLARRLAYFRTSE